MGWADCGNDSKGRPIGYAFEATCDHPECNAKIDRGLAFACGGMHGENDGFDCEGYFCEMHRTIAKLPPGEECTWSGIKGYIEVCLACAKHLANVCSQDEDDEEDG